MFFWDIVKLNYKNDRVLINIGNWYDKWFGYLIKNVFYLKKKNLSLFY